MNGCQESLSFNISLHQLGFRSILGAIMLEEKLKSKQKKCVQCGEIYHPKDMMAYNRFEKRKFCSSDCASIANGMRMITFEMNGDCHECTSHALNTYGYPRLRAKGKQWLVSRYVYTQAYGQIPEGMFVLHSCDNPKCINIEHLRLGTNQDNMDDRTERGRSYKGERNWNSKLTEIQVLEIRCRKDSIANAASIYGVERVTIRRILNRTSWKHI